MKEQQATEATVKRPRGRPFGSTKKTLEKAAAPLSRKDLPLPPPIKEEPIVEKEELKQALEEPKARIEEEGALELVDSIEFRNGKNDLTIRLSKRHNRMFRVQVFLNGKTEIRPSTYTGNSPGMAFWSLLKDSLQ